jgi:hypothetical protein
MRHLIKENIKDEIKLGIIKKHFLGTVIWYCGSAIKVTDIYFEPWEDQMICVFVFEDVFEDWNERMLGMGALRKIVEHRYNVRFENQMKQR